MPARAVFAVLIASVAAVPSNVMPVLAGLLAAFHQLDERQIGFFVSCGTVAGLTVSATAPYWIARANVRVLITACLCVYAVGLVALGFASTAAIYPIQFVLGGTAVVVASCCISLLARLHNPARAMSIKTASDIVLASGLLYFLPIQMLGFRGMTLALAAVFVLALALTPKLPAHIAEGGRTNVPSRSLKEAPADAWLALATMAAFNIGGIAVWVFLGKLALHAGLDVRASANVIAAGLFVGVFGSLGAAALAGRSERIWPQVTSGIVFLFSVPALTAASGVVQFAAVVFVFNVAWNFFMPFVMGLLATRDDTGRLAALMPGTGMLGGILGPPLAGSLMAGVSYPAAMWAMTAIASVAVASYSWLSRTRA